MWMGVDRFPAPGVTGPMPPGFGLREMEQKQTKILSDSVPFVGFCEETDREQTRVGLVDAITRRCPDFTLRCRPGNWRGLHQCIFVYCGAVNGPLDKKQKHPHAANNF